MNEIGGGGFLTFLDQYPLVTLPGQAGGPRITLAGNTIGPSNSLPPYAVQLSGLYLQLLVACPR